MSFRVKVCPCCFVSQKKWNCSASKYTTCLQFKEPCTDLTYLLMAFDTCHLNNFKQLFCSWECNTQNISLCFQKKKSYLRAKMILHVFNMREMSKMQWIQLANTWRLWRNCENSQGLQTDLLLLCSIINIKVLWIFQISKNERFLQWLLSGLWYHHDRLCSPVPPPQPQRLSRGETLLCR